MAKILDNGTNSLPWASRGSDANEPQPTTPSVDMNNKTALLSAAKVMVNGAFVNFGAYESDSFNYFKLTDILMPSTALVVSLKSHKTQKNPLLKW